MPTPTFPQEADRFALVYRGTDLRSGKWRISDGMMVCCIADDGSDPQDGRFYAVKRTAHDGRYELAIRIARRRATITYVASGDAVPADKVEVIGRAMFWGQMDYGES